MAKLTNVYTKETEKNERRKKIIKTTTYSLIVAFTIILGATLVAVNANKEKTSTPVLETAINQISYSSPLKDAVVYKDYNANELQYNDTLKQWEIHKAIDLVSDSSTEVLAIANGTVTNIYTNYLEGTVIEISHSNGLVSIYKSLNQDVKVKLGDSVKQGAVIGNIANTMSRELNSGNHLHLEIFINKTAVNPNEYIDFSKK